MSRAVVDQGAAGETAALYRLVWRWHFIAGLIAVPFLIVLSLTGALYLFKPQIEAVLHADLRMAQDAGPALPASVLGAAALEAAGPGARLTAFVPPVAAGRSAEVEILAKDGRRLTVHVEPASGRVRGTIDEDARFMNLVKEIHGTLMLGLPGEIWVEIVASWTLVMLVTGLYLWWPRGRRAADGVLLPRLSAGGRTAVRDLHAIGGLCVALLIAALLVTGLPWTKVSGGALSQGAAAIGAGAPAGVFGPGPRTEDTGAPLLDLDALKARAEALGFRPPYAIHPARGAGGSATLRTRADDPRAIRVVHLDPRTGAVVKSIAWDDFGAIGKAISYGVALHEGRLFGLANQILGLIAALGVLGLAISGTITWWLRRPKGRLAAPPGPRGFRPSAGFIAVLAVLAVLLPMFAATAAVAALAMGLAGRLRRGRAAA